MGALVLLAATVAWASVLLAHLGAHSLADVALLTAVVVAATGVALRRWGVPPLTVDGRELAALAGLVAVGAALFLPGFPYAVGDKDPGVYVEHAFAISRTGSYAIPDPVLARHLPHTDLIADPPTLYPGVWVAEHHPDRVTTQFFDLYPATLATANDVGGQRGLFNVNPLLGILSVLVVALALRRALSTVASPAMAAAAGELAGLLLAVNMMQIWNAKFPATEAIAQLLVLGSLFTALVTIMCDWPLAAAVSGLLAGLVFVDRPDGFLVVLLVAAAGGALLAGGRWDRRAWWFAAAFVPPTLHAFVEADVIHHRYSRANGVPSSPEMVAAVAALLVGGWLARRWLMPRLEARAWFTDPRGQRRAALVVVTLAGLGLIAALLRPAVVGNATMAGLRSGRARSWDEHNMLRLVWFFSPVGIVLAWLGLAVAALRMRRGLLWLLLGPGLLVTPLYIYDARISSRLMWWTRRFIPFSVAVVVMLIAIALAHGLTLANRRGLRAAAGAAAAFVVVYSLVQAGPLRHHREYAHSLDLVRSISTLAGSGPGVFVWQYPELNDIYDPSYLLAGPVALIGGQVSTYDDPTATAATLIRFRSAFPGHPVFYVGRGDALPTTMAGAGLTKAKSFVVDLPRFDEADDHVPRHATHVHIDITIWRLAG
ncbi:MAG: hypothetical protein QOG03_1930 [Actinomycetota bacterium]|nr:hypothetical protein [Actinomycetota bacterium]